MDILATLQNCIQALGAVQLRIDQEETSKIIRAVRNTLHEVQVEMQKPEDKQDEVKQEEPEHAENNDEQGENVPG